MNTDDIMNNHYSNNYEEDVRFDKDKAHLIRDYLSDLDHDQFFFIIIRKTNSKILIHLFR